MIEFIGISDVENNKYKLLLQLIKKSKMILFYSLKNYFK